MRNGWRQLALTARALVCVLALAAPRASQAQIGGVQLPNLPRVELPNAVTGTVNGAVGTVRDELGNVQRLADLRQLRVRELLRTQRQFVERDPSGAPILRAEIVALSPTETALEAARSAGFTVARERVLDGLDARVVVLRAPEGTPTRRALSRLRSLDPNGSYDYNHIYMDSGAVASAKEESLFILPNQREKKTPQWSEEALASSSRTVRANSRFRLSQAAQSSTALPASSSAKIGLIDGGIDTSHPVFDKAVIYQYGCNNTPIPSSHGTAVASLLIGRSPTFHGAAPGAALYAADVYCGNNIGGAVDSVVDAIAWLARERVPVMNISLVGPRNLTLENVVKIVVAKGYIIVAAVGNDGAAAPPLYPASYPGVVGVTAVDAKQKVLLEACRGPQVDFAAPGADMAAAMLSPAFAAVRGTSFAAPIVAGLLAARVSEVSPGASGRALAQLTTEATDLGAKGTDKVYGNGLVGDALRTTPALALTGPAR